MTESDEYVLDVIRQRVWGGFDTQDEVQQAIEDILEEDSDEAMLRRAVGEEFARKREAERGWPAVTDCDRLDMAFYKLHETGICALSNAGYTMSDGFSDVAEVIGQAPPGHYHGFCFYHGQDVERAIEGMGVMIAFGDAEDREAEGVVVGQAVAAAMTAAGFAVEWDGTMDTRINLPALDWKRRGPPGHAHDLAQPLPGDTTQPGPRKWWQFWR